MIQDLQMFLHMHKLWKKRYSNAVKNNNPPPPTTQLWAQGQRINVLYGIECSHAAIVAKFKELTFKQL